MRDFEAHSGSDVMGAIDFDSDIRGGAGLARGRSPSRRNQALREII